MTTETVSIRPCQGLEELRACVALQKDAWKFSDAELMPARLFVVAEKIGGQVIGAFAGGELIGFAVALPGVRGGHCYLHSQMLAVHEPYRDQGIGRRLKLFQREEALRRGFELMEWTFDPLEIKNAYLNIEKLGAVARRYTVNQYGASSSPLQGGLPTDRLVAEWWLNSKRVLARVRGESVPSWQPETTVPVPEQVGTWKASPELRQRALEVQARNGRELRSAFEGGLSVLGYELGPEGDGRFLLGKWDEPWMY